jgi:type VI secretion system secreted protein Hcp
MAVDMFIKIGDIKGESTDDKHAAWIDVLSWSWGASQSGSAHMGGGSGAGKVQVQDLTLTKYVDAATPTLLKMCCDGSHIKVCKLTVRKAGKDALEYLKLTLEDAIVTSIATVGSGGQDRLTENVTLNFARFGLTYTPQATTGGAAPSVSGGWDIAANKPFEAK